MLHVISAISKKAYEWWEDEEDQPNQEERIINDDNLDDYLVDNVEKEPYDHAVSTDWKTDIEPVPQEEMSLTDYRSEIPTINQLLTPNAEREHIYSDPHNLIEDAMTDREVIGFDYINRHGAYAGWRTVEPHYTFVAYTTGNEILVTWDRDINDIRAFIVGNIQPEAVRYEGESFEPRGEIMIGAY